MFQDASIGEVKVIYCIKYIAVLNATEVSVIDQCCHGNVKGGQIYPILTFRG